MSTNGLVSRRDRLQTIGRLYSSIEDSNAARDISFDGEGVLAFCGSQGTNHVWYGERVETDDKTVTFRVLKLEPTKSKGMHPNKRTGVPEFGTRLTNVRYVVGDVTIPQFSQNASLGGVLREVQGEFRHVQRSRPLESGNVHNDREVESVYTRLFPR